MTDTHFFVRKRSHLKILVVADREEPLLYDYFNPERFSDIDLVISCGDLPGEYLSFIATMLNVPVFYVRGNHDVSYASRPPEGCTNIDGRVVNYKGIRIAGLEGSRRYTDDAVQYSEREMFWKLIALKPKLWLSRGIDILVTHAPPYSVHDLPDVCHQGFKVFLKMIKSYKPRYFLHGHVHLNYKARQERITRVASTCVVNGHGFYILNYETSDGPGDCSTVP
ncbi:MAG TPA: metallophosphoesterase, partial [Firmicutes bacterium]|nr:metallophosphoesterase [Bacillota bacterium]